MKAIKRNPIIRKYFLVFSLTWTICILGSAIWYISETKNTTTTLATREARAHFQKDQAFRYWAAGHGGVYVPTDERTLPNKYLDQVPERDIITRTGKKMTLMNPAYMLRQMMDDYADLYGVKGRITSLKPFEPGNTPDAWEQEALQEFERGTKEVFTFTSINRAPYLRLIQPMYVTEDCLKCHAVQGYKVGDVRGGVGVSLPMAPYLALEQRKIRQVALSHSLIWLVGLIGLVFGFRKINGHLLARKKAEQEREAVIGDLQQALENVKTLEGLLPICAKCKKIRDDRDKGYWKSLETYLHEHSELSFSHGICSDCADELYGSEDWFQGMDDPK